MSEQSVKPVVVIAVGVIASMSFNTGYDIGIMSSAKRLMALDLDLSPWQVSVLVGSLNIVTGLASLLSGLAADTLGRKRLILLSSFICTVAVLLMGAASGPNAFAMVMLGRTFNGIGTGLALQVSQCFVAEIAPKHIRGLLGASFELFINIGDSRRVHPAIRLRSSPDHARFAGFRHPDGLHRRLGALRSARWHRLAADDWAGRCAARGRPARDAVHARVAALPPRSWPRGRGGASLVSTRLPRRQPPCRRCKRRRPSTPELVRAPGCSRRHGWSSVRPRHARASSRMPRS